MKNPQKISVLDLNLAAYHHLNQNTPTLEMKNTRIVFTFTADDTFYKLTKEFNENMVVNILDFVNAQRQLRAKMYAMRGQRDE
jgi:hypothetical protein